MVVYVTSLKNYFTKTYITTLFTLNKIYNQNGASYQLYYLIYFNVMDESDLVKLFSCNQYGGIP